MSTSSKLAFSISPISAGLSLDVVLDDQVIYHASPNPQPVKIIHEFDDLTTGDHVLCFIMTGKTAEHTQCDVQGNIISDCAITISDISLGDIQLGHLMVEKSQYYHDFNGSAEPVIDKFYGIMGCNGCVELKFSTPVFMWLLENM